MGRSSQFTSTFFSHSSGEVRIFTQCNIESHGPCTKYRQMKGFLDDATAIVWMVGWRLCGQRHDNKKAHLKEEPSPEDLAMARAIVDAGVH